jgi:hypothetical protein
MGLFIGIIYVSIAYIISGIIEKNIEKLRSMPYYNYIDKYVDDYLHNKAAIMLVILVLLLILF